MSKEFSHADSMARAIYRMLKKLKDESYNVKILADHAGCSTSLVYEWIPDISDDEWRAGYVPKSPAGNYLYALANQLSEKEGDDRLLAVAFPTFGKLVVEDREEPVADGWQNEANELVETTARLIQSGEGRDGDGLRLVGAKLHELGDRCFAEGDAIEHNINRQMRNAI